MPWDDKDASSKTKKAKTPKQKRQWASTANAVLKDSGDEGKAVRVASAAIAKAKKAESSIRSGKKR